jgi:hypothetical protein
MNKNVNHESLLNQVLYVYTNQLILCPPVQGMIFEKKVNVKGKSSHGGKIQSMRAEKPEQVYLKNVTEKKISLGGEALFQE